MWQVDKMSSAFYYEKSTPNFAIGNPVDASLSSLPYSFDKRHYKKDSRFVNDLYTLTYDDHESLDSVRLFSTFANQVSVIVHQFTWNYKNGRVRVQLFFDKFRPGFNDFQCEQFTKRNNCLTCSTSIESIRVYEKKLYKQVNVKKRCVLLWLCFLESPFRALVLPRKKR